jgi:leucine-zipper of insertion element IS481
MGISRKCVWTWITRFEDEGEAGLIDRSSRPHTSPRRTPAEVEDLLMHVLTDQPSAVAAHLRSTT